MDTPAPPSDAPPPFARYRCAFCDKPGREVGKLVVSPTNDAAICNECVIVAVEKMLATKAAKDAT